MIDNLVITPDLLDVPESTPPPDPDIEALLNDKRPKIQLPGDNRLLSETAADMGKFLKKRELFRRDDLVFHLMAGEAGLRPMSPETFRSWCEQHLLCYRVRNVFGRGQCCFLRTMSAAEAQGVLAAPTVSWVPAPVERFNPVRMPVRRASGEITLLPEGYDAESLTFTASSGIKLPEMTLGEARTSLENLLKEFGFADSGRSKAVVISAMLTVFGIGLLPPLALPPAFIFLANREGAGKTLLAKVCTIPVLGYAPTSAWPRNDEEMDKRLLVTVMGGLPALILDNVRSHIASAPLELFLTNSHFKGRILGQSKEFTGKKSTVVFLTGNGATVSPDMRRRSLFVELFLEVERAEDRVFRTRLEAPLLLKHRDRILAALWALIRSWDEAGRPQPSRINSGFTDWSEIFGGIVEHAGFECPLVTPEIEGAADTDLSDMLTLVQGLGGVESARTLTFTDLIAHAQERGLFTRLIPEEGDLERSSRSALSKLLTRFDRCALGGWRFSIQGSGRNRRFRVERITR